MVLIDDVLQGLRMGRPTALRRLIAIADVSISAAVVDEVRKHLPRRAIESGLDPDVALEVFQSSYLPRLAIRESSGEASGDPRVKQVAARDPKDVETAELVVSLAPAVCLTRDNDLLAYGLGTAEWLDLVFAIEAVAEFKALFEGSILLVYMAGRGILQASKTNPWLVAIVLGVLGGLALRLPDPVSTLRRNRQGLTALGQVYLESASRGVVAEAYVNSQLILPSPNPDVE